VTGVIDRISIWMAPYASPTAGYYVQVFKGKPGSLLLGKSPTIYPNAGIRTPQRYYDFQFSSASITLNAGSMYSWKLVPTGYSGTFNKCPNSIPGNGYWLGKYSCPWLNDSLSHNASAVMTLEEEIAMSLQQMEPFSPQHPVVNKIAYNFAMNVCESLSSRQYHCHWVPHSSISQRLCHACPPICRSVDHTLNFAQYMIGAVIFRITISIPSIGIMMIISDIVSRQYQVG